MDLLLYLLKYPIHNIFFVLTLIGVLYIFSRDIRAFKNLIYIEGTVIGYKYSHKWYLFGQRNFIAITKLVKPYNHQEAYLHGAYGCLKLQQGLDIKGYFSRVNDNKFQEISSIGFFGGIAFLSGTFVFFIPFIGIENKELVGFLFSVCGYLFFICLILGLILQALYERYCFGIRYFQTFFQSVSTKNLETKIGKDRYIELITDSNKMLSYQEALSLYNYELTHLTKKAIIPLSIFVLLGWYFFMQFIY